MSGEYWAPPDDKAAAAAIEASWPGTAKLVVSALDYHRRAALWAVTETRRALPAAAVVFTAAGTAPRNPPLHAGAACAAPAARFCYADGDEGCAERNRAYLAVPDPARVSAVQAAAGDPEGVLAAVAAAGIPVKGVPLSVHPVLTASRWDRAKATGVLSAYRRLLAPGSSVCLSCGVASRTPDGDALLAAVRAHTGKAYRHEAGEITGWLEDAGLVLHPQGVTDARAFGRPAMQDQINALRPVARILTAVGIVPGWDR